MSLKRAILDETSTAAEKIAKTSFATADACKLTKSRDYN